MIDRRGNAFLKTRGGVLEPYGLRVAEAASDKMTPRAKPGSGDTTAPTVTGLNPAAGATIGSSYTFQATVTDAGGLKSVRFTIQKQGVDRAEFLAGIGRQQRLVDRDHRSHERQLELVRRRHGQGQQRHDEVRRIHGLDRRRRWRRHGCQRGVAAGRRRADRGRPHLLRDAEQLTPHALGGLRLLRHGRQRRQQQRPLDHRDRRRTASTTTRTKAFARNVLFIPNQDGTTGAGTDLNCTNDPLGCWTPSFGVVDINWTTRTFPNNVAWDYAFYVVNNTGRTPAPAAPEALELATGTLPISFAPPAVNDGVPGATSGDFTYALGYSYSEDPNFMYCAEDMTTEGTRQLVAAELRPLGRLVGRPVGAADEHAARARAPSSRSIRGATRTAGHGGTEAQRHLRVVRVLGSEACSGTGPGSGRRRWPQGEPARSTQTTAHCRPNLRPGRAAACEQWR